MTVDINDWGLDFIIVVYLQNMTVWINIGYMLILETGCIKYIYIYTLLEASIAPEN